MHVSILKTLQDQRVFAGETATFAVKLSRNDAVGVWKYNGREIVSSDRYVKKILLEH